MRININLQNHESEFAGFIFGSIYERRKLSRILSREYEQLLANDEELAEEYGFLCKE